MGFLDKLKQVGHAITGGAAEVTVDLPEDISLGKPFDVKIVAIVDDQELDIEGVYLLVRADAEVHIDPSNIALGLRDKAELSDDGWTDQEFGDPTHQEFGSEQTTEERIDLADERTLQPGERCEWTLRVTLPADAKPSCYDEHHRHVWHIQAGLDAVGNDPDSGWVEFTVGE